MKFLNTISMQQALAEEAQGNFTQAAALYAQAGELEKVGAMYEFAGDLTRFTAEKIQAYQQALHWYKQAEHREAVAQKLAQTIELDVREHPSSAAADKQRLTDVAEYYALAKDWERAGKIYEELHMDAEAIEMYIQGGAIDQIERLSSVQHSEVHQRVTAQQYYLEAQGHNRIGQRDRAVQSLQQCLTLHPYHTDAQQMFAGLQQRLAPTERRRLRVPAEDSEYLLFGKTLITLGRKEDNDLVIAQHDISRHHARLGFVNQACVLEDLHSSNGTRLNGLRIQRTATIQDRDVIGVGLKQQFEVCLQQRPSGMSAILRPLDDTESIRRRYILFSGDLFIGSDAACELPLQSLISTDLPYLLKLTYNAPYWQLAIHPHATQVELNGTAVEEYVTLAAGDALVVSGITVLFD